jgi:Cytosolic carboxypeptidase N-terminal domain
MFGSKNKSSSSDASSNNVTVSISDAFDGGNIKFIGTRPNELDPQNTTDVILHIKPDRYTELEKIGHMQYFCFRSTVSGILPKSNKPHKVKYIIENAEATSYPEAWFGEYTQKMVKKEIVSYV